LVRCDAEMSIPWCGQKAKAAGGMVTNGNNEALHPCSQMFLTEIQRNECFYRISW
jgi:hypothetical protein